MDVLFAKEKLLQMHSKSFQIKINNRLNAKVVKKEVRFDLSKLDLQEKVEFLQLLQKTKRSSRELLSVQLTGQERRGEEVIDIDHEVVEDVNVSKIKIKELPTSSLESSATGNAFLDVQLKLKQALQRKAEQEFKRKGSKNV